MIYTIDELREIVAPIARKYGLRAAYLFGSYARNEATENSDVDILIDRTGSSVHTMYDMGGLYEELRAGINKEIDLVTTQSLEQESAKRRVPFFVKAALSERVSIYGQSRKAVTL